MGRLQPASSSQQLPWLTRIDRESIAIHLPGSLAAVLLKSGILHPASATLMVSAMHRAPSRSSPRVYGQLLWAIPWVRSAGSGPSIPAATLTLSTRHLSRVSPSYPALLADSKPEFTLSGSAAAGVTLASDPPTLQADGSYRYQFTGEFVAGDVILTWIADGLEDANGFQLTVGAISLWP
jgi:hypothetical protein